MNRPGLHRIIRAAAAALGEVTVVIIGSQSILASFREFMLPDDATMSAEADVLPFDDEGEEKADMVDGLLGEASHFYDMYGIYADGVSPWTASLPTGWDDRLVTSMDSAIGAVLITPKAEPTWNALGHDCHEVSWVVGLGAMGECGWNVVDRP